MPAGQPPEVQFPFSVDLTKAITSIEQFQVLVREMSATVTNAQKGLQTSFDETARAEKQVAVAATEATTAVGRTTAATVAQEKAAAGLAATTKSSAGATSAAATEIGKITAATDKAVKGQNAFAKGFGLIRTAANILPGLGISGIFLLIFEGISKAAEGLDLFAKKTETLADKTKRIREENEKYIDTLTAIERATLKGQQAAQGEITALDSLYRATQNTNLSQKERLAAVDELQKKYPDYFGKLSDEAILAGKAATAYDQLKEAIIAGAKARAAAAIIEEDQKTVLINEKRIVDLQREQIKNLAEFQKLQEVGNFNTGGGSTGGAGGLGNLSNAAQVNAAQSKINDNVKKETELRLLNLQLKEEDLALTKEISTQQEKGGIPAITGSYGDANAGKKAAADKAKLDKLKADQEKAFNDLLFKIIQERQSFQAKSIADDEAAEIAASKVKFQQLVEARTKEKDAANVNADQRRILESKLVDDILAIDKASTQARLDIEAKYEAQRRKLREAAESAIATLGDNRQEIEVKKIEEEYKQKAETIRKGELLTQEVQEAINKAKQNAIDDVNIKYGTERIKKQTDLEIAGIKVAEKFQGESVKVEKAKQIAILDAQLQGALAQLNLLQTNGKDKNSIEVLQAQETVDNLRQAIKNANKNAGEQSLFEFLGISSDTQKYVEKYAKAFESAGKIVSDFAQTFVDAYDRQLKAKQKLIDQDDKAINDLESRLDKEKELKDQGLANDYDRLQSDLDAKKAQRAEDVASAEEIQKKKQAALKVQLIADTVAQGSNLITASTEIFKTFSAIPIVGVPLAIAAIGLMLGTFVAAKVQAFKAIGDTPTFEKGGEVKDGHSHREGGIAMVDRKSGKEIGELQRNEFIVNAENYRKSKELVQAINSGKIFDMHPESLEHMLEGMGISLPKDQPQQMIMQVGKRDEAARNAAMFGSNPAIDSIDANVQYLANQKRSEVKRWEDEKYYYEQRGNKISKTPKQ